MTKPIVTAVPPIANPVDPVPQNTNPTTTRPPTGLSAPDRTQPEKSTFVLNIPVSTSNASTQVGSTTTVQSGPPICSAVEIEPIPHHCLPIPPKLPASISNSPASLNVTRPGQSDPLTLTEKKRKHASDSNGDIQATSPAPDENNSSPANVPRSTASMSMERNNQNNRILSGQSARLPFIPFVAEHASPCQFQTNAFGN